MQSLNGLQSKQQRAIISEVTEMALNRRSVNIHGLGHEKAGDHSFPVPTKMLLIWLSQSPSSDFQTLSGLEEEPQKKLFWEVTKEAKDFDSTGITSYQTDYLQWEMNKGTTVGPGWWENLPQWLDYTQDRKWEKTNEGAGKALVVSMPSSHFDNEHQELD